MREDDSKFKNRFNLCEKRQQHSFVRIDAKQVWCFNLQVIESLVNNEKLDKVNEKIDEALRIRCVFIS